MARPGRFTIVALVLGLLVWAGWVVLRAPAVGAFSARDIREVLVRFESWDEDNPAPPEKLSADPEAISALVEVLQTAKETDDHKCGSRGIITLRRSVGRSAELRFLPGHHEDWYEFRYGRRIYRVPRAEFVAAMHHIGVDVPLKP